MEKKSFNWSILEYKEKSRSVDWYWAVGIITIAIIGIAIFFHNFLFAVLILLSVITLIMYTIKTPKIIECYVDERGVSMGNSFESFSELDSFWITPGKEPKIILKPKKGMQQLIIIEIREVDPYDLRSFILNFLPEKQMEEPLPGKIMDFLGF